MSFKPPYDRIPPCPPFQFGFYRHYKGGIYLLVGVVFNTATEAWDARYRPHPAVQDLQFTRPFAEFDGMVNETTKRFEWISPDTVQEFLK